MSGTAALREKLVFGLGNPLLDISCNVELEFLNKWNLKENDAILADERHNGLVDDLVKNYDPKFIAGGSVQNTMRMVQWLVGKPGVCSFMGCIGNDFFGRCMSFKATEDGVNCVYMIDENAKTGHCAVMITDNGKHRSLAAFLGAANNFHKDHLDKHWEVAKSSQYFYVSGFALTVSMPSVLKVAEFANSNDEKTFFFNLSAAYISLAFSQQLMQVIPYVDILFGNETEAIAFAELIKFENKNDMIAVAKMIANVERKNKTKSRMVVITQGCDPVIVVYKNEVKTFPVKKLDANEIVDTNGAGDAFVAGFISQYIQRKPIEDCVNVAIYAAQQIIRQDGCSIPLHSPEVDK